MQSVGFSVVLRPLEVALNHSLVWNMSSLPYAHQGFCDCGGNGRLKCIKIWDPHLDDFWETRYKFERSRYFFNVDRATGNITVQEVSQFNANEKFVVVNSVRGDKIVRGTLNIRYLHKLPQGWTWHRPHHLCI